ncbi:MAG: ThuA domain-containing protein [Planctomycetota bacterium]
MRRRKFLCLVAVASVCFLGGEAPKEKAKIRVLLVTGCDVGAHKWRETSPEIRKILEETGRFEVVVSEEPEVLAADAIHGYDAIFMNYMNAGRPSLSEAAKKNLVRFVESGKGLVPFHFTTAAFRDWDAEYIPLIGRAWRDGSGHGPRGKFAAEIADKDHPITKGLADFEADDELYAKLVGDAPIHVLVRAKSEWSGRVEPLAFTHTYGKGRVFGFLFGHDLKALENPSVRKILARGTEWAARGAVAD